MRCLKHIKWEGRVLLCSKCKELIAIYCDNELKIFPWHNDIQDDVLEFVNKNPPVGLQSVDVKSELDHYINHIRFQELVGCEEEYEEEYEDI